MTNLEASQPVPAWPSFLRPILEVLSDGQGWKTGDLKPAAVARLQNNAGASAEASATGAKGGRDSEQHAPIEAGSASIDKHGGG